MTFYFSFIKRTKTIWSNVKAVSHGGSLSILLNLESYHYALSREMTLGA